MHIKLNDRQKHVLWATVRQYVATARPVGSETLLEEYDMNVSSATVRNAMGRLEKFGLLYQPHTSAGRVPSDSGYRIYVDSLLTPSEAMRQQVQTLLNARLNWEAWSLEAALRGAADILAVLSGYITLITLPQAITATLRHVQLVPVEASRMMLILVLDTYETQSILMSLPSSPEGDRRDSDLLSQELEILSNFLNHHLKGRSLQEIHSLDWNDLDHAFKHYAELLQDTLMALGKRIGHSSGSSQLLISGLAEVLRRHPEFSEIEKVQTIIHLLESERDSLLPLFFETPSDSTMSNVMIRIGSENPLEPMQNCALVSSTYKWGETSMGSIGILGPTRMVYEDAIALVEATSHLLSEVVTQSA
ncbi:MAG: heat-inducible transcriptional repressor HrcA [Leptolyngbyaceae bacterium]|nr:heat-inducible transcriptional repressor HrcA [Leptolyngbyaceae bacterium]